MQESWDAVVVGAGPAGCAAATWLAGRGAKVALVETWAGQRRKVCGEFLGPAAWPVFRALGVDGAVRREAQPIRSLALILPGERRIDAPVPASGGDGPVSLSRQRLDQLLVERAQAVGVQVFQGWQAGQVLVEDGHARGIMVRPAGSTEQQPFRTDALIAADGRSSGIVRQTGSTRYRGPRLVAFKCHLGPNPPPADPEELGMHSLPGGYIGRSTVEGSRQNLCGVMPRQRLLAADGNIDQAVRGWVGDHPLLARLLDEHADHDGWTSASNICIQRSRPRLPGVIYVGDAQGTIEPLTGQGMSMALVGAWFASEALAGGARLAASEAAQADFARRWDAWYRTRLHSAFWLGQCLRRPRVLACLRALHGIHANLSSAVLEGIYRRIPHPPDGIRPVTV
jgi:2-polyprenyl-6-methoxyphenol hydroxylase-like FAD-dependent oxidoreductase